MHREPAREIPVYGSYHVVVAGGGCAGFAAAVAAARSGAKTLVVERFPYFGGTATASLMGNINGFRNQVEPDHLQTTRGIGEELILRMIAAGGTGESPYPQKEYPGTPGNLSYSYAVDIERLKYEMLRMVVDSGASILFHTWIADAIYDRVSRPGDDARPTAAERPGSRGADSVVRGIIVENKSGRQAIRADVVVDATGDADVAARASASYWQTAADEAPRLRDELMYKVEGLEPSAELHAVRFGRTALLWGPGAPAANGADADQLTAEEITTRLAVYDDLAAKKAKNPALEPLRLVETPPLLGIRQTRFVDGLHRLTGDEVIEGAVAADSVAMGSAPIIHYYGYRRYLTHTGYGIPYRCLVPARTNGLLIAGRCISSDQRAYESLRSMATILAVGEAAGTAAALAARRSQQPREINVDELRRILIAAGAEVGEPALRPSP